MDFLKLKPNKKMLILSFVSESNARIFYLRHLQNRGLVFHPPESRINNDEHTSLRMNACWWWRREWRSTGPTSLSLLRQFTHSCSFPQAVHSFLSVLALAHAELILVLALAVHAFLFLPRQFSHSFSCPDRVIHSFLFLPRQFTRPGFAKQFTHSCSCPGSSLILVLPRQFTHSRSCTGGSLIPVLAQAVHWFMFFGFPLISILAQAFTHSSLLSRAISFYSLLPFGREVCEWLAHADHSLLFFFRQFPHSSPCSSVHSSSNCLISYQFTLSLKTSLLTH
jgi:hypothetical protein